MAGLYPDAIGPRLPYDRDGTVGLHYDTASGAITQRAQSALAALNDETAGSAWGHGGGGSQVWSGLIFPTPIDLMGYFILSSGTQTFWTLGAIQTSLDTTNLSDGTWTQIAASHTANSVISPNYRNNQVPLAANGIKALRFRLTSGGGAVGYSWASLHLYGKYSNVTDRLELWHPTLNQPLSDFPAYFDYGDVSRGTGALTRDFRVKNLSTGLTASSITVGAEAPTDTSPTYVSQTTFRYNGGSYGPTATLGALGPGATSQIFTARLDTLSTATLGLWAQRYYAQAAGWS